MTISKPPDQQPPEDDTALLIAALNHAWTWWDGQINRTLQVINYFLVASAVLATAYVGAINGKHYPLAAGIALAGIGLTAVTSLSELKRRVAVNFGGPVLAELQRRVADRLKIDMAGMIGNQAWAGRTARIARGAYPGSAIGLGLAFLVSISALLYAVIR
jgi:hypothetical protein